MKYRSLGRSGLKVSPLCLGTMNFGPETSEKDSHLIMAAALNSGVNFFDTANVYGWKQGEGWTEQIVGRWLAEDKRRREEIVLATKVYGRMGKGPNERRLSAYHIRRACDESLLRLKTDRIDLYQMHHIDPETPWDEIWQAMEQLVQAGKILYVGSSNFPGWQIATANQTAAHRNFLGLISEQSVYSLQNRAIELEVIPACRAYGLGVIPYSPLAGGLLAGGLGEATEGRRTDSEIRELAARNKDRIEQFNLLCKDMGESPASVALAWVSSNPAVNSTIIGPRTLKQFKSALETLSIRINGDLRKKLDTIWPGPGGEAPEAYA
ncbi:MAG TPA: aldo/keto reductase, partial [Nitrospiria bacterium]|nr:aldo/keto reductase [Nitrospiria bacterium]